MVVEPMLELWQTFWDNEVMGMRKKYHLTICTGLTKTVSSASYGPSVMIDKASFLTQKCPG